MCIFIFLLTLLVSILWKRSNTTQRTGWPSFGAIVCADWGGVLATKTMKAPSQSQSQNYGSGFYYILLFLFPSSANGSPDDACNHREDESHRVMGWSHNVSAFYNNTLSLSLLHAPLLTTKSYAFCFSSTRTRNWEKCRIIVALENCETPDLVENERW